MSGDLWPQEIWLCQSFGCGLRFPARRGDERAFQCPLCGSLTAFVECFDRPPATKSPAQASLGRLTVVLDNIRSANNVGSIIRTADGLGAEVAFGGFTATPDNPKVVKTSLGSHDHVPWSRHLNTLAYVQELKKSGTQIWALELTERSGSIACVERSGEPLALVVGNEVSGIDPAILRIADEHVHLPMVGTKTSLNVAVALGAALYIMALGQ